jgi:hypothetical protein
MQAFTFSGHASLQQVRGRQVAHAPASGSARATGHIAGYQLLAGSRSRCPQTARQSLPESLPGWAGDALVLGTVASSVTATVATAVANSRADKARWTVAPAAFEVSSFSYDFSYAMMSVLAIFPFFNWTVRI